MAPTAILRRAVVTASSAEIAHQLTRRALKVNDAQKVTLGIIAVYIVVIALLWNLPYVRWSLWPFKVSCILTAGFTVLLLTRPCLDAHNSLS